MNNLNTLPITDAETYALSVHKGGTAAYTAKEAAENLNLLTYDNPSSVRLDEQGKLIVSQFSNIPFGSTVSIKGPSQLYVGTVTEFEITDYDSTRFYEIFFDNCIVKREEDKIYVQTFSIPIIAFFEINKRRYEFNVIHSPVNKPVIAYPSNGSTELDSILTFESNLFSMANSYDEHASSDWQIAVDIDFNNIVKETSYDPNHRLQWTVSELIQNTTYYLRVRHRSIFSGASEWSNTCIFKTRTQYKPAPPILENPEPDSNNVNLKATFTFSDFEVLGKANDRHIKTDWQLAADSNFDTVIKSSFDDVENLNSWYIEGLNDLRVYYIRARYTGVNYGQGDWSSAYSFTTIVSNTVSTPVIASPVRNSTGNALDQVVRASVFNVSDGFDTHLNTDWQLALDANFSVLIQQSLNDTVNKTTWTLNTLLPNRNYYLRVRYRGAVLGLSHWSNPVVFKTIGVDRPSVIAPANNATDQKLHVTLQSSAFSATGTEDDHATSDWQIASDAAFNTILLSSIDDPVNLTSINVTLNLNTTYYVRVRHNGAIFGKGDWSDGIKFSTITKFIVIPPRIMSPETGINNQSSTVKITGNAFSVNDGTDTHSMSYWQLAKDAEFTQIVQTSIDDSVNLTSWTVTNLEANTVYYVRMKYKGTANGYSDWSLVSNFKTVASYNPVKPTIEYPLNKANNMNLSDLIESSAFEMTGGTDTHAASDWQIATDINFTNLVKSEINSVRLILYAYSGLSDLTKYYVRVRHKGQNTGYGPWSEPIEFTTIIGNSVSTPTITSPSNNASGIQTSVTLLSSNFAVSGGSDTHQSSDWQVATDSAFINVVAIANGDTVNKTKFTPANLVSSKTYYARVRYKGSVLPYSAWSPTITFSTVGLTKPSITNPVNGQGDVFPSIIFKSSAFTSQIGSDTHKSSDWQISTDQDFMTIIASTANDTVNKTTWAAALSINTTYYIRVRYTGVSYGTSAWSDPVSFTTIKNFTVNKPTITSPVNNAQNLRDTLTITSTAFGTSGGSDYQVSSDWQIATDNAFVNVVKSSINDGGNLTSWTVTGLSTSTLYYVRVKHEGAILGASDWSNPIMFSTKNNFEPTSEEASFYAGDRGYQNHFGERVCMSGDGQRVCVHDPVNGGIYIFRKSGTSWLQEYKAPIAYSDPGIDLDYEGKTLAIGNPTDGTPEVPRTGSVSVYTRSNTSWALTGNMVLSSAVVFGNESFGKAVSLTSTGDLCIVGAPGFNVDGVSMGAAFIFRRDGNTWSQSSRLTPTDGLAGDGFGNAVSIANNGTKAVVAASNATRFSSWYSGNAYVYKNMLEFWQEEGILSPSDRSNMAYFGKAISMSGDGQRVIVGTNVGRAYIYKYGASWSQEARLDKGNSFGKTVALDLGGSRAIVGDASYSIGDVYSAVGCAYTFSRNGSTWSSGTVVTPSTKKTGLQYGVSVDIAADGARAVVGAYDMALGSIGMIGSGPGSSTSGQVFILS